MAKTRLSNEKSASAVHAFFAAVVQGHFKLPVTVREQLLLYFLLGLDLGEILKNTGHLDLECRIPFESGERLRLRQQVTDLGARLDSQQIAPGWHADFERVLALHYPQSVMESDINDNGNVIPLEPRRRAAAKGR
ncbi:MAG: hypothetical protein Q8Q36_03185 [bacterium]|nr:hypothetical protein [bacterium]